MSYDLLLRMTRLKSEVTRPRQVCGRCLFCCCVLIAECGDREDDGRAGGHHELISCDYGCAGSRHQHGRHHCHPVTCRWTDLCHGRQQRTNCCHSCCYTGSSLCCHPLIHSDYPQTLLISFLTALASEVLQSIMSIFLFVSTLAFDLYFCIFVGMETV